MILDKIQEYLDGMNIARLSADELKVVTECAIMLQKYNDDKAVKEAMSEELNNIHLTRV